MAIVVFKGLLGHDESDSFVRDSLAFLALSQSSKTSAFTIEHGEIFESVLLGHRNLDLDQGPLTVAALGVNPPEKSIHFHVSLFSKSVDTISAVVQGPSLDESKALSEQLNRLSTKNLTVIIGSGVDHGLVSEARIEIQTTRPSDLIIQGVAASLPQGEGEHEIRRFIDDSVNLLSEQEFNARRIDLGFSPINLAWPWGQGERPKVSNRALALGRPWRVVANSLTLRGLARLSGFRTESFGRSFRDGLVSVTKEPATLMVFDFSSFESDAMEKLVSDLSDQYLMPLIEWQRDSKTSLAVVATDRRGRGLVAVAAGPNDRDHFPFDERSLMEKRVDQMDLGELLSVAH